MPTHPVSCILSTIFIIDLPVSGSDAAIMSPRDQKRSIQSFKNYRKTLAMPADYIRMVFFTHIKTEHFDRPQYYNSRKTFIYSFLFNIRHIFPSNRQKIPSKKIKITYFSAPDFFWPPVQLPEAAQSPEESKRREFRK